MKPGNLYGHLWTGQYDDAAAFFSKLPTQPDLVFPRGRREISAMDAAFVGSS